MSLITTKGRFHVAIDGLGLLLQGAPDRLSYQQNQAPIYGNRFASGDRSYTDFSFWWYWTQTDFSGGIKHEEEWEDDAKYLASEGISTQEQPGEVILAPAFLDTDSRAKSMLFTDYGETNLSSSMKRVLVGRNVTDQKMCIIDMQIGHTPIWEDSATGADEKILCCESFGGDGGLLLGCKTVGSGSSKLKKAIGTSITDIGTHTAGNGIYAIVCDNNTDLAYAFTLDDGIYEVDYLAGSLTQKTTKYPLDVGATAFSFGKLNGKGAWISGDQIYFLMLANGCSHLYSYDITNNAYVFIFTFGRGYAPMRLIERDGNIYCFGQNTATNHAEVWKYNIGTGDIGLLHEIGRIGDSYALVANPIKDASNIYFTLDDGSSDYEIWGIDKNDALWSSLSPASDYATAITLLASTMEGFITVAKEGASGTNKWDTLNPSPGSDRRQESGIIYTSIFDGSIPAIDKLFQSTIINFKKLTTGQSITVEYSIDTGSTWTSLGSASYSVDGGSIVSKTFYFGTAIIAKRIQLRFTLAGNGGMTTPTLQAQSTQYVPVPDYTKAWSITINGANDLKRLDGSLVELSGRELRGQLMRTWLTKSLVDFQDLDFAQTTIDGGSLSASATTVTVQANGTADFPEQGRIRIENEEITYTGKTPTSFTGCVRGARGTIATTHADDTVVSNAYRVFITEMSERVPISLEDKNMEFVIGLNFREA